MTTGSVFVVWPPRGGWLWRPLVGASLSQVVLGAMRPAVSYAGLELGADGFMIGVLAASFAVLPMFIALPLGGLTGRLRRIGLVPTCSAILLALACVLAALWHSLFALVLASALLGVANLGVLLGAQSWISRSAPSSRYNDGFGWMTAGMALGQAVGPLAAGALVGPVNPSMAGIVQAFWLAAAVSLVLAFVFVSPAVREYSGDEANERVRSREIVRTPGVFRYIVMSAVVLTSVDILTAYLPVLGAEAGIAPVLIGAMLAVRGVSSMASRLLLGPLGRRWGDDTLITASAVGAALCLAVVALITVPWVMFAALAIGGFFLGMGQSLTMTAVAVALPAHARSSGLALRLLGNRVAQTAVPLAAGTITGVFGVASVFVLQVVSLAASAVWEIAAVRRKS